ncbi:N-acetyltransferase [Bacteroidia bacterium]|nr:N-acetyltransferase [Bacteroidia bacterium]GHT03645.1 N-acetyltransferase [Bacteroidia bacterium]
MALLENDTILLRALEPEDLDVLYKWENDAGLWHYGSTLTPYSRFVLRDYLSQSLSNDIFQSRQLRLMIVEKASHNAIGTIDLYDFDPVNLRAGIGILLDADYRRQGFGWQALQLIHEYAAQVLFLKQLYVQVPKSNIPSYKLFQKSGYKETGLLEAWIKTAEGFVDAYFMQLPLCHLF